MGRAKQVHSQDFWDTHHLWWPRSLYRGSPATQFRNLACHKVELHRRDHNHRHATEQPPKRPSTAHMAKVVREHTKERFCYQGICFGEGE